MLTKSLQISTKYDDIDTHDVSNCKKYPLVVLSSWNPLWINVFLAYHTMNSTSFHIYWNYTYNIEMFFRSFVFSICLWKCHCRSSLSSYIDDSRFSVLRTSICEQNNGYENKLWRYVFTVFSIRHIKCLFQFSSLKIDIPIDGTACKHSKLTKKKSTA